jgi:hypothetical protein
MTSCCSFEVSPDDSNLPVQSRKDTRGLSQQGNDEALLELEHSEWAGCGQPYPQNGSAQRLVAL